MAKKKRKRSTGKKNHGRQRNSNKSAVNSRLHPDAKKSIWGIVFLVLAIIFILAGAEKAGPAGELIFGIFDTLLGLGYFILPAVLFFLSGVFFISERQEIVATTLVGGAFFLLAALGLIDIYSPNDGGWLGLLLGSLEAPFGRIAATIINAAILIIAAVVAGNTPLRLRPRKKAEKSEDDEGEEAPIITGAGIEEEDDKKSKRKAEKSEDDSKGKEADEAEPKVAEPKEPEKSDSKKGFFSGGGKALSGYEYTPPPLSLLQSKTEKPTTGDLRANANVIKRTLESFGIPVEMGEINIGPKVTRYTLKPAEGVKLSKITALNQDLALALAAHPIRIEAPIPGKSLVGIEVPNKAAAMVHLGSLMGYKEFASAGPLGFVLGRDVTGEPVFGNIEKMPHLLIAGATGSGKSIMVHSLLISLLYKNSPETMRLVLIDPKRVELSSYDHLPHLISPVITDNKKAIGVFRWAISEMERRYEVLLKAGSRDIRSYNKDKAENPMPYLLIVVDELADLMSSYGKEVEGSIVRLAQMARATGIHLVLSTQRPSVEIITGLIKANITSRIALQVASQVDSRTILDTSGAEKLLGGGDLLFISAELSKPKRIQGCFVSEREIQKVTHFVRTKNDAPEADEEDPGEEEEKDDVSAISPMSSGGGSDVFDKFLESDEEDELFDEALRVIVEAEKASASLLQRRLKVGYARAARLLDIMEDRGLVGPADGAKPREIYMDQIDSGEAEIRD